ncbi:xylosidase/arabinosidase [Sorangium cellulosum]|uniref:Xylosidase/arabinosidase n=1 Tax=Sorangium cellulosum TaxID=56 RepID=A0A2L0EYI1_SORCE|nr:family 43 glycosylhydrolase [Sorangium cellulosum]AUX44340.1 xylosidase/arabinosidase [Sorangium cellulosum]
MKQHSASITAMILMGCLPISCGEEVRPVPLPPAPLEYALTIEARGDGTTAPPPGTYLHEAGTVVTVTAIPAPSADFAGWSGAASEADDAVEITVDGGKTLTAAFETATWPNEPSATYLNPILPGDHPDMNVYVEGDDFYITGSSFNIAPNVEILHSRDLIHWERVSRVVDPAWSGLEASTSAGGGTWGGFIVKVAAGYRVYFAVNFNQYFAEADSLAGPWGEPVHVEPLGPYTPPGEDPELVSFDRGTGYDDSVFVDDDGTTYLVVKAGQCKWNGLTGGEENNFGVNLLQKIDPETGQLTGETIDLSFVNWNTQNGGCGDPATDPDNAVEENWAEGPTMTKRNGFYYYFDSTHTGCGGEQVGWRSATLSSNPADWAPLGSVLKGDAPFSGAQHSSAPFQIADGTWWVFSHSYECDNSWRGLGRQGLLSQVTWMDDEGGAGVPVVNGRLGEPAPAPALPPSGIPFLLPVNDDFEQEKLSPAWTFYGNMPSDRYSVTDRRGWLRVKPAKDETRWVIQKDALHAKAMVVRMDFAPTAEGDAAGVRLGNAVFPEQELTAFPTWASAASLEVSVARVRADGGDRIRFAFRSVVPVLSADGSAYESTDATVISYDAEAPSDQVLWLKLVHGEDHQATGWFSTDRLTWTQVGEPIDISALEDYDTVNTGWVGSQAGVFASNTSADFDLFTYRDGFTGIAAAEPDQESSTEVMSSPSEGPVLGGLEDGDWAMYGSVDLGSGGVESTEIELRASSAKGGAVEVWLDPLAGGRRVATCDIPATGGWETWTTATCKVSAAGTHEVYLKAKGGSGELLRLASLRFVPGKN